MYEWTEKGNMDTVLDSNTLDQRPQSSHVWGCPQGQPDYEVWRHSSRDCPHFWHHCKAGEVSSQNHPQCWEFTRRKSYRTSWKLWHPQLCWTTGKEYRIKSVEGRDTWSRVCAGSQCKASDHPGIDVWQNTWNITHQGSSPKALMFRSFGGLFTLIWLNDWSSTGWSQPPAKVPCLSQVAGPSGMASSHPKMIRCD